MDASSADSTSALAPDSMKMTTEDGLEQEMELTPDSITSESLEAKKVVSPASLELAPDSMEMMTEVGVEMMTEDGVSAKRTKISRLNALKRNKRTP